MSISARSAHPPAIVLGGVGAALSITRNLGREGVPVYVLGDTSCSLAGASRHCTEFVDCGGGEGDVDGWLAWLRESAPRGSVVLPCGDPGLSLLATHDAELRELGLLPSPTAGEASLAMLDKERTYEIAREAGIPAPRTWRVTDNGDLDAIAAELEYPCGLKPLHSHLFAAHFGDLKLFLAHSLEELRAALALTEEHALEMQVTEIIPGGDHRVWSFMSLLDDDGEPLFEATKRKLRCYPIHFGVGTYHVTDDDPELAALGLDFLRAAGLRGLASVEFKRDDRDGGLKLIECNHRFSAANEVICRAGVPVPLLVYRHALGEPVRGGAPRPGVCLWMPGIDRKAAAEMRAEGDLTWPRWLTSILRRRVHTHVFSAGDLRPSVVNVWRRVGTRAAALFGRFRRRPEPAPATAGGLSIDETGAEMFAWSLL